MNEIKHLNENTGGNIAIIDGNETLLFEKTGIEFAVFEDFTHDELITNYKNRMNGIPLPNVVIKEETANTLRKSLIGSLLLNHLIWIRADQIKIL